MIAYFINGPLDLTKQDIEEKEWFFSYFTREEDDIVKHTYRKIYEVSGYFSVFILDKESFYKSDAQGNWASYD